MGKRGELRFDEIGYWSELKLDIVKAYAAEYSKILSAQQGLYHVYIDGFAGAGVHISRATGDFVPGSPLNALLVQPPFREYYLIDLDRAKAAALRELVGERADVHVFAEDANRALLDKVFPNVRFEDYRRGLCLLDPYGLHLSWEVIAAAGRMKSVDVFLNFPVADINRNVIWRDPTGVRDSDVRRMNAFWGDGSWRNIAYTTEETLFGPEQVKVDNRTVAEAFRQRLRDAAGFRLVPEPLPMRNSTGAVVYHLFFASQKPVAAKIVRYIFDKYRDRGAAEWR